MAQDFAVTPKKQLTAAVAPAGTFTLDYPVGFGVGNFGLDAPKHVLLVGANFYEDATKFSVAFGATQITVTWKGSGSIAAGSYVQAQLDIRGGSDANPTQRVYPARVNAQTVVKASLGAPIATAAANLRAAAAVGGAGALALLLATLDVPRNLIFTSSGNDTGITFTITGKDEASRTVVETVTGANAGVAAGKKAFKTITSIVASGASAGTVAVGIGNVLGLPVWVPNAGAILKEFQDNTVPTAGTFVAGLARATTPSATTADVCGTYVPNSAPDGAKVYDILLLLDDPTYTGVQFAG